MRDILLRCDNSNWCVADTAPGAGMGAPSEKSSREGSSTIGAWQKDGTRQADANQWTFCAEGLALGGEARIARRAALISPGGT